MPRESSRVPSVQTSRLSAWPPAAMRCWTELSLRLYDSVLRELAPRHLTSHARAVRRLNDLLPSVVVQELDRLELDCRCICPMCSLGACGCTEAGRGWISEAWQGAQPEVDERPGLAVTPPRHGSQLAEQGVRGGDRLIAIDGKPLTTSGMSAVIDIPAAIRKHAIGDELLLAIACDAEQSVVGEVNPERSLALQGATGESCLGS
jgi:hypothetical protein